MNRAPAHEEMAPEKDAAYLSYCRERIENSRSEESYYKGLLRWSLVIALVSGSVLGLKLALRWVHSHPASIAGQLNDIICSVSGVLCLFSAITALIGWAGWRECRGHSCEEVVLQRCMGHAEWVAARGAVPEEECLAQRQVEAVRVCTVL